MPRFLSQLHSGCAFVESKINNLYKNKKRKGEKSQYTSMSVKMFVTQVVLVISVISTMHMNINIAKGCYNVQVVTIDVRVLKRRCREMCLVASPGCFSVRKG